MTEHTTGTEILLVEREGEPRARDIDIGERLGFARPRKIRDLIEANLSEIEAFGVCPAAGQTYSPRGGRPSKAYFLNEEQALLIATLSKAPNAPAVRSMLIRTFVAWRRGHLIPQTIDKAAIGRQVAAIVQDKLKEAMTTLLPAMVDERLLADPRRAALDLVAVRQLLDEAKALPKGRNKVNRKIGRGLMGETVLLIARGEPSPARKCPHTGVWLYKRDFADDFMRRRGLAFVADHNAAVTGQSVIPFPRHRVRTDSPPSASPDGPS